MTSILKEDDKIFTMYKQYKDFIYNDAKGKENENPVYVNADQLAAQLTLAHMLDHVGCLFKKGESPIVRKVNKMWEKKFGDGVEGKEKLEIRLNNAQITSSTSSSADVEINDWWGRRG